MNIDSDEADRLARELAALTGETVASAVTAALRERLERLRQERDPDLAERLRAIREDSAPSFKEPWRAIGPADLLYDERGLPGSR